MNKIKVLRVIARMNIGGPAFLIKELMTGIDENRFEQILVYGNCEGSELEIAGVGRLGRTQKLVNLARSVNIRSDLRSLYALNKIIRKEKPDIIDTHTFKAGFLIRVLYLVMPKKNTKIVHHYHGHLLNGYFRARTLVLYKLIEKTLARKADVLVTDGENITQQLVKSNIAPFGKFKHLMPGVAAPNSLMDFPRRAGLDSPEREIVIAFIGRLAPIKRPDRYLDLVKDLSGKRIDCRFVIYGDGELKEKIQEQILEEKLPVELRPFEKDVYQVLASVDILVMTSDNEGTPLTVMEASYAGVPCIGTNVGSMKDIVKDGVNGFLVNPDAESLANILEDLLDDKLSLNQLKIRASKYAEQNFNVQNYVSEHEKLYAGLISSAN
jgi:glycosyltransferase involved in cell wall biosynthesis